jgi:hypothetical protein
LDGRGAIAQGTVRHRIIEAAHLLFRAGGVDIGLKAAGLSSAVAMFLTINCVVVIVERADHCGFRQWYFLITTAEALLAFFFCSMSLHPVTAFADPYPASGEALA